MPAAKKKTVRYLVICLFVLAGFAGAAYLYPDLWRGTKLGEWITSREKGSVREVFYCPMHPDYKSDKPGTCPICNMDLQKLEPEPGTAAQQQPTKVAEKESGEQRKILYWQDAMNPSYRSDKPGKAPDGMDLVPVYADESPPGGEPLPGAVRISPEKQQLIGVQIGQVSEQHLTKTVRTVGRIAYDETRMARIQTRIEGWIDKVYVDFTGRWIDHNQPLVSLYSPELVSTQQELLIAKRAKQSLGKSRIGEIAANAQSLYQSTRERLRLWNISEGQIREIEKRGAPINSLTLYSPVKGFVLTRNAFPGQRVTPETELYTIADLSVIWVLADVYEYEVPLIHLGQSAEMTLSYLPGKKFKGQVDFIYPQLDNTTRTLKVRLQFPNPNFELKPDMYANVEIAVDYGSQLAIPEEAILDSGTEQIAFVVREGGYFEPRRLELGQKVGRFFIVLDGVKAGERVVTSANFLIDSESQLKSALGSMEGMTKPANGSEPPAHTHN